MHNTQNIIRSSTLTSENINYLRFHGSRLGWTQTELKQWMSKINIMSTAVDFIEMSTTLHFSFLHVPAGNLVQDTKIFLKSHWPFFAFFQSSSHLNVVIRGFVLLWCVLMFVCLSHENGFWEKHISRGLLQSFKQHKFGLGIAFKETAQ